jgi:hypothetical protein
MEEKMKVLKISSILLLMSLSCNNYILAGKDERFLEKITKKETFSLQEKRKSQYQVELEKYTIFIIKQTKLDVLINQLDLTIEKCALASSEEDTDLTKINEAINHMHTAHILLENHDNFLKDILSNDGYKMFMKHHPKLEKSIAGLNSLVISLKTKEINEWIDAQISTLTGLLKVFEEKKLFDQM